MESEHEINSRNDAASWKEESPNVREHAAQIVQKIDAGCPVHELGEHVSYISGVSYHGNFRRETGATPASELIAPSPEDGKELLKNRYLSRGGGMLLVGQSGQGKSSLLWQMLVNWANRMADGTIPFICAGGRRLLFDWPSVRDAMLRRQRGGAN